MGIGTVTRPPRRPVFLDRNGKRYPPASVDEFERLTGTAEALAELAEAGFRLFVVRSQPNVPRSPGPRPCRGFPWTASTSVTTTIRTLVNAKAQTWASCGRCTGASRFPGKPLIRLGAPHRVD